MYIHINEGKSTAPHSESLSKLVLPTHVSQRLLRVSLRILRFHITVTLAGTRFKFLVGLGSTASGEDVDLRRDRVRADLARIRQAPRKPRDLPVVRLPLWDLARARELGLFLSRKGVCYQRTHCGCGWIIIRE